MSGSSVFATADRTSGYGESSSTGRLAEIGFRLKWKLTEHHSILVEVRIVELSKRRDLVDGDCEANRRLRTNSRLLGRYYDSPCFSTSFSSEMELWLFRIADMLTASQEGVLAEEDEKESLSDGEEREIDGSSGSVFKEAGCLAEKYERA